MTKLEVSSGTLSADTNWDEMDQYQEAENSFDTLGLDARLVRALEKLKYANPTPVQVR